MFSFWIIIVLIIYGITAIPFYLVMLYLIFFRRGTTYRITVKGKFIPEFEQLLNNIITTQKTFYGDSVQVRKL